MRRLDMLIAAAGDPAALFEDTRALSVRHVKARLDGGPLIFALSLALSLIHSLFLSLSSSLSLSLSLPAPLLFALSLPQSPTDALGYLAQYGARPEDSGAFASAFVDTVARQLGDLWCARARRHKKTDTRPYTQAHKCTHGRTHTNTRARARTHTHEDARTHGSAAGWGTVAQGPCAVIVREESADRMCCGGGRAKWGGVHFRRDGRAALV